MMKSWLAALSLFTALGCGSLMASSINLGTIASNNIAVLGYDSAQPTSSSVIVTNTGSTINVTGNVISPVITGASGLNFTAGSGTGTPTTQEETDLANAVTALNALTYTSLTISTGVNMIAPGDYTINGTIGSTMTIDLTGSGQYVFKTTGSLNFTNVTINGNSSLSSDDVFWYTTGQATITNSQVFGDVVQASASNALLRAASSGGTLSGTLTGRFLSEGFDTSLTAAQGATLNINDFQAASAAPEPATFAFVFAGLACLGTVRLRR